MRSRIVKIGNSRGVRIPKPIIEQTGLVDEVDIQMVGNRLIIVPVVRPREHWEESFRKMTEKGDDALLDGDTYTPTVWDDREWEWK